MNMMPDDYADLEIRILKKEKEGYPVEMTFSGEHGKQEFGPGYLKPDVLPWRRSYSQEENGKWLFSQLFADERLKTAWAEARGQSPLRRVRLRIDESAPELHTIPWELLRDASPGLTPQTLAAETATPFSRYLAGQWRHGQPILTRPIKLLVALANPEDLGDYNLSTLDLEAEEKSLRAAISEAGIETNQLDITFLEQPVTLPALEAELKKGYNILHLVAHGMFLKEDELAYLFLASKKNKVDRVSDDDFAEMLSRLGESLRLIFLASCQSATRSSADAFRGFAPKLVTSGVPAVLAMQDLIPITTARKFASTFYCQLIRHGLVDRACNEARSAVLTAKLSGASIPVLFMRLRDGQLFAPPSERPGVPFMVEDLPQDFVDRPEEFNQLIELLLDEQGASVSITAALRGAGGYGKTMLARAICFNERVRQAFSDGIVWVTLGENPGDLTGRVEDLIEIISGERPGFADIAAASRLREVLEDRRLLLVIDDVWNQSHLNPFMQGGPQCARLITTRNNDTLPHHAKRVDVDAMQQSEAVKLLSADLLEMGSTSKVASISAPPKMEPTSKVDTIYQEFQALATRLGEWPLLLKLVNGVLRNRVHNLNQSLPNALDYANKALDKCGLCAFDAHNAEARNQAVTKTIAVSLELLTESERQRYSELAIFLEDIDIPFVTIEKLWNKTGELNDFDTENLCVRLYGLSLLLKCDLSTSTIRLHDVMRTYLTQQQSKETLRELHNELLAAYTLEKWTDLAPEELYLWKYLAYHLIEAGREEELHKLLFDIDWMWSKLTATDVNALIADYDICTAHVPVCNDEALRLIQGAIRLSAHILAQNKAELPGQIVGRLCSFKKPEIVQLLEQIKAWETQPWLCPLFPTLKQAGGAEKMTLSGHTDKVNSVAVTPDGQRIVSASRNRTLKVWELASGMCLQTMKGHTDGVNSVAVTPDGRRTISASTDQRLKVWELASGMCLQTMKGHTGGVLGVAVTPDGRRTISASTDQRLKVWELASGMCLQTMKGHTGGVHSVAVTPDGRRTISASWDGTLKVWDLATGACLQTMKGHTSWVLGVVVTPDGRRTISASWDWTLKVWDLAMGACLQTLEGHTGGLFDGVTGVAVTPDGQRAISASKDKTLKVWDLATGVCLQTLEGHTGGLFDGVTGVAVTPDGQRVISASSDRTLKVWDLATGMIIASFNLDEPLYTCAVSPDGKTIVAGGASGQVHFLRLMTGENYKDCT